MHPADKAAGQRLRLVRKQFKQTTYQMAEVLGIPQSTYSKYENGHLSIRIDVLKELYQKLKVKPNYICLGELPMIEGKSDQKTLLTDMAEMKAVAESVSAKMDFWIKRGR